jgi:hypothetical protein
MLGHASLNGALSANGGLALVGFFQSDESAMVSGPVMALVAPAVLPPV